MPGSTHLKSGRHRLLHAAGLAFWLVLVPLVLACYFLKIWKYDVSVPFFYDNDDPIWQLTLTKLLLDTGWILTNPFMGAPGVAQWYNNPAAQASALHSVLMWIVGRVVPDAVAVQQCYFILNFSLITITGYIASRLIGIRTFLAVCIGLLFAFLPAKFNLVMYAFLANYFMIPLAIVPAIWVLVGRFAERADSLPHPRGIFRSIRSIATSRLFLIGLAIVVTTAATDGYYAFFALLLLGLAMALRVLLGDLRRPRAFAAPLLLVVALIVTALAIVEPLRIYQHRHPDEFSPQGVLDPALKRYPFEAVVYSSSLMVMLSPSNRHRIPILARIGRSIVDSSNRARLYPTAQWAPLGTLGTSLFLAMLAYVATTLVRRDRPAAPGRFPLDLPPDARQLLGATIVLALFVTGCSIFGGFGAMIALIYPAIRGYERFPVFLSFLLLCGAGVVLTSVLDRCGRRARWAVSGVAALVTVLALFDQAPADLFDGGASKSGKFLAERRFVHGIEAALPDMAMVYQDPYSNYLIDNHYYGWGSFADMRFYLHSRRLRWSSGASKNSPVDQWHEKLAQLPTDRRLTEIQAAGFQGFLVDRTVVADSEYADIRSILTDRTGQPPVEDAASRLAFWTLPDPGYRLVYGPDFLDPVRVVVTDPAKLAHEPLSRLLDRTALERLLATETAGAPSAGSPLVIERAAHPEVFRDAGALDRGLGQAPIATPPGVAGDVSCPEDAGRTLSVSHDRLTLHIHNRSEFDWLLNSTGPFPLRIGMMQLLDADGHQLRWDGGFRAAGTLRLGEGESAELSVPLAGLDLHTNVPGSVTQVTAVFALLQEANAWFGTAAGNAVCRVTLER